VSTRGQPKQKRAAPQSPPRKPYSVRVVTVAAFLLPGSGQMLNGDAVRGIVMQFFMLLLAFITYQLSGPDISFIGRISGGLLVYVFSVVDANNVAKRRNRAWERISADRAKGDPNKPRSPRQKGQ
jgi:hypothetical protein